MNKIILLFFIGFAFGCREKTPSESDTANVKDIIIDSLTMELKDVHKKGYINGYAVAVVNQNGTLYQTGIGYANSATNENYTENTIQNVGSVSKTLIGIALLKAQEMGKLILDDPINKYLPFRVDNPNHPGDQITIRHLATHTSTILDTDYYDRKTYVLKDNLKSPNPALDELDENFNSPDSRIPMIEFLEKILSVEGEWYKKDGFSKNRPGEIYKYSNFGATLAAAILEIAVNEPYSKFTTEHILKPLKMTASGWSFNTIDLSKHSKIYANPKTEIPYYSLITYADGGLLTSINDLGKYLAELIKGYSGEGTLLEKNSYQELFKEQLSANSFPNRNKEDDYDDEYNTGIFMGFTPKGFIGHSGGDPGIATYMFFNPKTKIGRILMINTSLNKSGGVEEFYSIWNILGKYENKLN